MNSTGTTIVRHHKACLICKNVLHISRFSKNRLTKDGKSKQCRNCAKLYRIKHFSRDREKQRVKDRSYKRTLKGKYTNLKTTSKSRGLEVNISFEEYKKIIIKNECYYCAGQLPEASYGLDRKNPKIGYTIKNSVPCCTICNRGKTTQTVKEFVKRCKIIAERFK